MELKKVFSGDGIFNAVCWLSNLDFSLILLMNQENQMSIYDDHIQLWNEGVLPEDYTVETLMRKHI